MAASSTVTPVKCARCKEKDLDTTGEPKWCKACRAAYQRDYQAGRGAMWESRGFAAGITAMRHHLGAHFKLFGNAHFSGVEICQMIMKAPEPK